MLDIEEFKKKLDKKSRLMGIDPGKKHIGIAISDENKISIIQNNVREILQTLGMDMNDDSLKGTPLRVAKAYVKEIFGGTKIDE